MFMFGSKEFERDIKKKNCMDFRRNVRIHLELNGTILLQSKLNFFNARLRKNAFPKTRLNFR